MARRRPAHVSIPISATSSGWRTGSTSSYNSLQARLEKRFSKGLSAHVSYTWGKALTDAPDHISTSGGGAGVDTGTFREPQDGNNLRAERGLAEFDIKHRFVASYIWELPFGRGRRYRQRLEPGDGACVLGGWQLTGIHVASERSRADGDARRRDGAEHRRRAPGAAESGRRPGAARSSQRTIDRWFNTDAFAAFSPAPQAFGNAGVGIMRGPGMMNFDFTLAKNFPVGDRRSLQFRTELFNAFNRANFGPPNIARDSSGFGQILTAGTARIIQFGLKFYF